VPGLLQFGPAQLGVGESGRILRIDDVIDIPAWSANSAIRPLAWLGQFWLRVRGKEGHGVLAAHSSPIHSSGVNAE